MPVHIRPARPEDAPLMTDLVIRSKQSNGYDDAFMAACRDELSITADQFEARAFWVAEDDGLCGVVGLTADRGSPSGEVCSFFVDPDCKRKGVGRLLWRALVVYAAANGLTSFRLDADPAAVPFYEALGFRTVGYVPSGSIAGRTLPHMEIDLKTGG